MNDVAELTVHVAAHAAALDIDAAGYRDLTARIHHDGAGPGSWVHEWSGLAAAREARGDLLGAAACYSFARFPFVDSPARQGALDNCVRATDRWRLEVAPEVADIERLELDVLGGRVVAWTTGLVGRGVHAGGPPAGALPTAAVPAGGRPLLIVTGGIVSVKEQWAPLLLLAARLGLAAVVTEMPGVGENTLRYTADSWRMFPAILDALGGGADVTRTFALALSFSGQMALRWAAEDTRVRGIITTGAPVRALFTDRAWQRALPPATVATLAHLTGADPGELPDLLPGWALSDDQLTAVGVPVRYVASTRDEIIPPADVALLRRTLRDLAVLEHDDVHGAPGHAVQTRGWMSRALVDLRDATSG
ncbi:hydrolase superfamily dihydrolipoamide acyltransferase-like protein [Parafrankia colletiae]|uniref:Hydrolase superfamily dihydrolipoamide acyltransferase-like protein n=1 Tax=Parafrankia colletiae TaxID=573497 RepID=A0A1S1R472_9ACTN|nr:alpha/beta hydrolase [Parafrankia colletiae]MCK9900255.1 esterase FrsA [Frankia sp. Cpl3]OHV40295.1 hydrolase superfamily dihydrolipoamide acyltransferase-like protein [Parafrankia colletiae]